MAGIIRAEPTVRVDNRRHLREQILQAVAAGEKNLVLDFSDTMEIDACSIGVVLGSVRYARDRGVHVSVRGIRPGLVPSLASLARVLSLDS